ncbi:class I lanthipeptide [Lacinutrix neustonica]|uniref:Class I lanthipeptide n=1 Tax=Lacinutrix neustonica TaxID=2980107 RepID=A0A9E8MU62_9FLAO|nr:class I lanthipeptide [Lacinutrix neustonica]WAC01015.1 class I lanthipeptide [Lacinutrix neustonica]
MKTQNTNLSFSKNTMVELDEDQLLAIEGGSLGAFALGVALGILYELV